MTDEKWLIDVNAIPEGATTLSTDGRLYIAWSEIIKVPTVDAVEVIRCEFCKHRAEAKNTGEYFCVNPYYGMASGVELKNEDFCSYGERKDNG